MKTRMERYHSGDITPQRVDKNTHIYDEIYSTKKEPTSNITVLDNVNEIDINKIKSMINNREEYKKAKTYSSLIGREERHYNENIEFNFDEPEPKDYDINEILRRKRSNKDDVVESEKIRKISNTQYDILKGLSLKEHEEEEMDTDFFTQEKELKSLISTITEKKEEKTTTDFFKDLKGDNDDEDLTPPKIVEEKKEEPKENNEFYSSKFSFEKDDFEDLEDLKNEVKKHNVTMKVLLILIVCIVIVAIVVLAINYIDFSSLLK